MKIVSIKMQRILMFIPYLNILNLFIWVYNCRCANISAAVFGRSLLLIFAHAFPFAALHILLANLFPELSGKFAFLFMYGMALSISYGLIKYQEKILKPSDSSK